MKTTFTLGQAIEWLMKYAPAKLIDSDGDAWNYDGEQDMILTTRRGGPVVGNLPLPVFLKHTFTIPTAKELDHGKQRET